MTNKSKLQSDLEKTARVQKLLPWVIVIVALSTGLQYAGVFSTGFLPNWFGLVVIAACVIQFPLLSKKITRLRKEIDRE